MTGKKINLGVLIFTLVFLQACQTNIGKKPIDYVDPFIGD